MMAVSDVERVLAAVLGSLSEETRLMGLMTRLALDLNHVVIGPSVIHSRGVFARHALETGSLITLYPGDLVVVTPNRDRARNPHVTHIYRSDQVIKKCGYPHCNLNDLFRYAYGMDETYALIGHPDLEIDPAYAGHMINDGDATDPLRSLDLQNCAFIHVKDHHVGVIATRPINSGEELLVSYGSAYWSLVSRS